MNSQSLTLKVSSSIGAVSADCKVPENSICIMTLAHGAGAGMNHPFMVTLSNYLAEANIATLRFNFPFIENKKKRPDLPAVAHKTVEAAMDYTRETFPDLPLFASGKSFGGRMTSQFLSVHPYPSVKGIIFYGFPLHPMGEPAIDRADHLKNIQAPMLFLQGTRDQLATMNLVEEVSSKLPKATLVKMEGADHSFKAGKQDVIRMLVNASLDWIKNELRD